MGGCKRNISAFQKILYERYYGYAMTICIRYATGHDEAAEILNDGFVKVFRAISRFDEPEDQTALQKVFMAWLKVIMINTGINHFKSGIRRISWSAIDEIADPVYPDQNRGEDQLGYETLIMLIQQLSPAYRSTFNLYVIEGYKHEEIANLLGISVGTSKSNLLKARKNLRKMLEKIEGDKFWKYG